jgi:peptidyl-tRNA hydrolase
MVMYLLAPARVDGPGGALLADAGRATLLCAERFEGSEPWGPAFREWEKSSFRKVCLRAGVEELERAAALEHARAGDVLCFPPRRRLAAEEPLARLKAHVGPALSASGDLETVAGAALLLVRDGLEMTLGKACAQVGHAVLLLRDAVGAGGMTAWRSAGLPVVVGLCREELFERARGELPAVAVRDAGFTQVSPGTETVLALAPGVAVPGWLLGGVSAVR